MEEYELNQNIINMKNVNSSPLVIFSIGIFLFTCFISLATVYPPQGEASVSKESLNAEKLSRIDENSVFSTNTNGDQNLESYGRPLVQGESMINYEEIPEEKPVDNNVKDEVKNVVKNEPVLPHVVNPSQNVSSEKSNLANEIIQEVNRIRVDLGLLILEYSQPATNMAVSRCNDMATAESLLDHSDLAKRQSYFGVLPPATTAAENLAYFSSSSAKFVVSKWMESSIHRDNIVNPNFTKVGAGAIEKNGLFYYALELSN